MCRNPVKDNAVHDTTRHWTPRIPNAVDRERWARGSGWCAIATANQPSRRRSVHVTESGFSMSARGASGAKVHRTRYGGTGIRTTVAPCRSLSDSNLLHDAHATRAASRAYGGTGIRTQEAVRLPVFKTGAMGRSAIPPHPDGRERPTKGCRCRSRLTPEADSGSRTRPARRGPAARRRRPAGARTMRRRRPTRSARAAPPARR